MTIGPGNATLDQVVRGWEPKFDSSMTVCDGSRAAANGPCWDVMAAIHLPSVAEGAD